MVRLANRRWGSGRNHSQNSIRRGGEGGEQGKGLERGNRGMGGIAVKWRERQM